ncbi:DNA primase [Streptomyces sp. NPDC003032]
MNRLAVGLAVGAGYVLGRTKKAKFAFAVGTMVAGKRLRLSPKALGALVTQQLENNPQFKEIGDQLREDMRGVGKAATGSLLNRQLEGLADRLHDRTLDVQDRISGVVPDGAKRAVGRDEQDEDEDEDAESEPAGRRGKAPAKRTPGSKPRSADKPEPKSGPESKSDAKSATKSAAKKAPAKKTAQNTSRKSAQNKTAQNKTAKKSTSAARGTARKTASAARTGGGAKGGDHG